MGRLVSRKQGSNRTDIEIGLERNGKVSIGFGNRQEKHAEVDASINHFSDFDPVYSVRLSGKVLLNWPW